MERNLLVEDQQIVADEHQIVNSGEIEGDKSGVFSTKSLVRAPEESFLRAKRQRMPIGVEPVQCSPKAYREYCGIAIADNLGICMDTGARPEGKPDSDITISIGISAYGVDDDRLNNSKSERIEEFIVSAEREHTPSIEYRYDCSVQRVSNYAQQIEALHFLIGSDPASHINKQDIGFATSQLFQKPKGISKLYCKLWLYWLCTAVGNMHDVRADTGIRQYVTGDDIRTVVGATSFYTGMTISTALGNAVFLGLGKYPMYNSGRSRGLDIEITADNLVTCYDVQAELPNVLDFNEVCSMLNAALLNFGNPAACREGLAAASYLYFSDQKSGGVVLPIECNLGLINKQPDVSGFSQSMVRSRQIYMTGAIIAHAADATAFDTFITAGYLDPNGAVNSCEWSSERAKYCRAYTLYEYTYNVQDVVFPTRNFDRYTPDPRNTYNLACIISAGVAVRGGCFWRYSQIMQNLKEISKAYAMHGEGFDALDNAILMLASWAIEVYSTGLLSTPPDIGYTMEDSTVARVRHFCSENVGIIQKVSGYWINRKVLVKPKLLPDLRVNRVKSKAQEPISVVTKSIAKRNATKNKPYFGKYGGKSEEEVETSEDNSEQESENSSDNDSHNSDDTLSNVQHAFKSKSKPTSWVEAEGEKKRDAFSMRTNNRSVDNAPSLNRSSIMEKYVEKYGDKLDSLYSKFDGMKNKPGAVQQGGQEVSRRVCSHQTISLRQAGADATLNEYIHNGNGIGPIYDYVEKDQSERGILLKEDGIVQEVIECHESLGVHVTIGDGSCFYHALNIGLVDNGMQELEERSDRPDMMEGELNYQSAKLLGSVYPELAVNIVILRHGSEGFEAYMYDFQKSNKTIFLLNTIEKDGIGHFSGITSAGEEDVDCGLYLKFGGKIKSTHIQI